MNQKGFTLIELLVVVAIIGVLAAVGVVAFNGFISTSKNTSYLKSEYKNPNGPLNGAWDHSTYFVDINQIPTSCTSNQIGYSFMTGVNDTRTIKFGTCCKIGQPAIEDKFKW